MDFENMMKFFQFFQKMTEFTKKQDEAKTEKPKKKEDMTAEERLEALEQMYDKKEEDDVLMKRIEALEKRAPKVTTDVPEPMGLDGILKGMIPGMMDGQPDGKGGNK